MVLLFSSIFSFSLNMFKNLFIQVFYGLLGKGSIVCAVLLQELNTGSQETTGKVFCCYLIGIMDNAESCVFIIKSFFFVNFSFHFSSIDTQELVPAFFDTTTWK